MVLLLIYFPDSQGWFRGCSQDLLHDDPVPGACKARTMVAVLVVPSGWPSDPGDPLWEGLLQLTSTCPFKPPGGF